MIASALKGMFSFFTMVPINIDQKNMDDMNKCFWLTPIIGLFYGLIAVVVFYFLSTYVSTFIAAASTIFIVSAMNRFLHLDGLIDVGDGLTVAGKREDHTRALKDTLIGAGGMATGLLVMLILFSEYISMSALTFLFLGLSAEVLCRNSQVAAAAFGIAGNGMAGASVRETKKPALIYSSVISIIIIAASFFVIMQMNGMSFDSSVTISYAVAIVAALFVSMIWGFVMSKIAEKNFGMVNGDVLGATNESARVILLFVMIVIFALYPVV